MSSKYFKIDNSELKYLRKEAVKKFLSAYSKNREYLRIGDYDSLFKAADDYDYFDNDSDEYSIVTQLALSLYFSDIEFLDKMSYIPESLFSSIKFSDGNITIPGNIKKVKSYSFYGIECNSDFKITLMEGVELVSEYIFDPHTKPKGSVTVFLPKSLKELTDSSFYHCTIKVPYKN